MTIRRQCSQLFGKNQAEPPDFYVRDVYKGRDPEGSYDQGSQRTHSLVAKGKE